MKQGLVVGLIGVNIQQSLSPALFEDACAAVGIRGYYHLMDLGQVAGGSLEVLMQATRTVGFRGLNITHPCKEAVLPMLDELSPEACQIGAVNTVSIGTDGRTTGHNTDRMGFRRAFEEHLGAASIAGKDAVLVGAGGAGRAVAFALFDLGVQTVLVSDKSVDRARHLVRALTAAFGAGAARVETDPSTGLAKAAGVINATPVGMLGHPGNAVPIDAIRAHHWVADIIYTPLETELVRAAIGKGARAMGGAGMCIHQAAGSFTIFTGLEADLRRMERTFAEMATIREGRLTELALHPTQGRSSLP
jgi:shikimate dehydrogenase